MISMRHRSAGRPGRALERPPSRKHRPNMRKGLFILLAGTTLVLAGCVSKITQDNPGKPPAYRDRLTTQYQHPAQKVFEAAKRAFVSYGTITRESSSVSSAAQLCFIEGTLNADRVYIRIEGTTPTTTRMTVQIRAPMGGTDLRMANELISRTDFELGR